MVCDVVCGLVCGMVVVWFVCDVVRVWCVEVQSWLWLMWYWLRTRLEDSSIDLSVVVDGWRRGEVGMMARS